MFTDTNKYIDMSHDEAINILTRRSRDCYGGDKQAYTMAINLLHEDKIKAKGGDMVGFERHN